RAEAQIRYSTEHDGLTGLANSTLFRNRLTELLTRPAEAHLPSVVLIDLDRFRNINEAFGRTTGDNLLVQFAQRLSALAHPTHLLRRSGSVVLEFVPAAAGQRPAVDGFAAAVLGVLNGPPFAFNGRRIHLSASIGIATARPNEDVEALHRRAELALRQAK